MDLVFRLCVEGEPIIVEIKHTCLFMEDFVAGARVEPHGS